MQVAARRGDALQHAAHERRGEDSACGEGVARDGLEGRRVAEDLVGGLGGVEQRQHEAQLAVGGLREPAQHADEVNVLPDRLGGLNRVENKETL